MASESLDELSNVSFTDVLDQDSRPTFVIDLDPDDLDTASTKEVILPIFCNAALRTFEQLLDAITGDDTAPIVRGSSLDKL